MKQIDIHWKSVEHDGFFDEAYLANIRKSLLEAEKEGVSVTVNFIHNAQDDSYLPAYQHAQRRLKNCKAVVNWEEKKVPAD